MKRFALTIALFLLAAPCMAAISVTYQWEPSLTPSTADNPVKYSLVICSDAALTQCIPNDAGTALTLVVQMNSGNYWVYILARNFAVSADNPDGPYTGVIQESDKSNIVATRVSIPPGNPRNARVRLQ